MSYDITLVEDHYHSNYTSNIYNMLQAAFKQLQKEEKAPNYYNHWSDPMIGSWEPNESRNYLIDLIKELKNNPNKYELLQPKIDPETGERWGSYKTCIEWLEDIVLNWKDGYRLEIDK
jgi:hypothetical protein